VSLTEPALACSFVVKDYVCSVLNALGVSVLGTVLGIRTVLEAEDIESAVHSIEDPNSKSKAARVAGIRGVSVTL